MCDADGKNMSIKVNMAIWEAHSEVLAPSLDENVVDKDITSIYQDPWKASVVSLSLGTLHLF